VLFSVIIVFLLFLQGTGECLHKPGKYHCKSTNTNKGLKTPRIKYHLIFSAPLCTLLRFYLEIKSSSLVAPSKITDAVIIENNVASFLTKTIQKYTQSILQYSSYFL